MVYSLKQTSIEATGLPEDKLVNMLFRQVQYNGRLKETGIHHNHYSWKCYGHVYIGIL